MSPPKQLYFVLLLCVSVTGFPTNGSTTAPPVTKDSSPEIEEATFTLPSTLKESQPVNSSSISTTSSLLFKDKKPILTYLLGQPKKHGGVSSPAQLLSPDRYEFFTFDDDGQIVKKLMSVKEIQRIIANNEKGGTGEHETPIEYYQILTVTPDVESIPSVSRINPNEPLFSIHDVIASVQNVLKSEMKIKQFPSSPQLNNSNYVASASSDHFEILTEQPPFTFKVEVQKKTSPAQQTTTLPSTFTLKQDSESEPQTTNQQPTSDKNSVISQENTATASGVEQPGSEPAVMHTLVPLVSSPVTHKSVPESSKETIDFAASTYKVINDASTGVQMPESQPLSLSDAHPGFLTNDTFLDMKPITVEQISHIAEPIIQELKSGGNFIKIDTVERNPAPVQLDSSPQTSTSKVEIPITPDLADSVSSVLWQIASENSMINGQNAATEAVAVSTVTTAKITSPTPTTEVPAQSRSTVKVEKLSESPLIALGNILIPQNSPRPFQKIPLIEKGTPDAVESRIEPFPTSTPAHELYSSPSSTVVILTEPEETSLASSVDDKLSNVTKQESSTVAPQNILISVAPDAVVQSPEHLKPVTEKVVLVNNTRDQNQTQQTIEGVQVIQEANIGQIPRTTEFPGQVVKEIQRLQVPFIDSSFTKETLSDSASNTFSTQLPYGVPEETTLRHDAEEQTEISTESEVLNTEANTEVTLQVAEVKSGDDQKDTSASDRVDITFVPMVIKTPSAFKQENLLKAEAQAEVTEDATTTADFTQQPEVTEYATEMAGTSTQGDTFESKELPESTLELKSATTEGSIQKEAVQADDLPPDFDSVGSLKQNVPTKPYFGKPQKPAYGKPVKAKPQTETKSPKPFVRVPPKESESKKPYENHLQSSPSVLELDAAPDENLGLEATVVNLDNDVKRFADLCNELAFSLWSSVTHNGLSFVRSIVVSPFAVTSLLAMVFLGARGPTSGQMNDILKLDDMVTFNPHLVFRNVTESLVISRNAGVATAAFVRELYSDKEEKCPVSRIQQYPGHRVKLVVLIIGCLGGMKAGFLGELKNIPACGSSALALACRMQKASKGKLLDFYKERVQQFYDGHVEEVNFKTIGDTLRRQTNHLVKRQTWGKITDFLRGSNLMPRPPLAAFSANIFQTDCTRASTRDRDGEMYFVILPASRLRRLVPIPAVVWRDSFLAGYEPNLDATAVSISPSDSTVSTIFVLPGQQGLIAPGDTLARLEHHLLGSSYKRGHWSRLMRSLLPRPGLELQIPRLSHKSVINVTSSLQRMGLKDLFSADKADLTGLNGLANDLHLSDMLQVNLFSTCGEEPIGSRHHSEVYPATPILRRDKSADTAFSDSVDNLFAVSDFEDPAISALPLELRPRQARVPLSSPGVRVPEPPRLRFDRPFLFFVRHNPTGLILHMGRFNPRLMP